MARVAQITVREALLQITLSWGGVLHLHQNFRALRLGGKLNDSRQCEPQSFPVLAHDALPSSLQAMSQHELRTMK